MRLQKYKSNIQITFKRYVSICCMRQGGWVLKMVSEERRMNGLGFAQVLVSPFTSSVPNESRRPSVAHLLSHGPPADAPSPAVASLVPSITHLLLLLTLSPLAPLAAVFFVISNFLASARKTNGTSAGCRSRL